MKRLFVLSLFIISLFCLSSCSSTKLSLHEQYFHDCEIKVSRTLTNSEYLELLDNALSAEKDFAYGIYEWHNFNISSDKSIFKFDFRGELSEYKAAFVFDDVNLEIYIKNGYVYLNKMGDKIKSPLYVDNDSFSIETLKQNMMYESYDYPTPYMLVQLLNETYDTENQTINRLVVDKNNNYVLDLVVNGDTSRFVFNEDCQLIYLYAKDIDDNYTYLTIYHEIPTIEYPDLSGYNS